MDNSQSLANTPFIAVNVICPICEKESIQYHFKCDSYISTSKEIDLKPKYEFKNKKHSKFNPTLFYLHQCPFCFFTGDKASFKDPVRDVTNSLASFRKKTIDLYKSNQDFLKVLRVLAEKIDDQLSVSYFQIIKRFFIAINHLEHVKTVKKKDSLPLARYLLHLTWLYQDLNNSKERDITYQKLAQLKSSLNGMWDDLPINEETACRRALHFYDVCFYASNVLNRKGIIHNILQLMGRLHVKLGEVNEGRNLLLKSIQYANQAVNDIKQELVTKSRLLTEDDKQELSQKTYRINMFIGETQDLLMQARERKRR